MSTTEIHIELLLGKKVLALNGRSIGRLEEMRTERIRNQLFVSEFLVGSYAVFERLSALSIGRAILTVLGAHRKGRGYRIPWDKMDLADPERPRLLCKVEELLSIND
jgi:sporulation protein YlmC with PRC-barrel domain